MRIYKKVKQSNILAETLKESNKYREAIECWDLCIKLNPDYVKDYLEKG